MDATAIWTEKYRPKAFAEMVGQHDIVARVEALVKKRNLPHLLFAGPAGVGKTTLALIIARALFGEQWSQNFLELNASDERGIDTVRSRVKDFARTKAIGDVPFKIIYLDECDSLTREAQQALRRTMENYAGTTRFILSCNWSSKIIDPIQSRTAVFKFKPLGPDEIKGIIERIAHGEKLKVDEKARAALIAACEGDVRRLENILQGAAALSANITEDAVASVASVAKPKEIADILSMAAAGKFVAARDKLLQTMLGYGLSGLDVIKQIQKAVWSAPATDRQKLAMMRACGEAEFRMVEGSDEFIQLEALLAEFALIASEK